MQDGTFNSFGSIKSRAAAVKIQISDCEKAYREYGQDQAITFATREQPTLSIAVYSFNVSFFPNGRNGEPWTILLIQRSDPHSNTMTANVDAACSFDDGSSWPYRTTRTFFRFSCTKKLNMHCPRSVTFRQHEHMLIWLQIENLEVDCPKSIAKSIMDDYEAMQYHEESFDVTLHVEGQSIRTHSYVLSRHSPVFSRMLSGAMAEAQTKIIEIVDFDIPTVRSLLKFLYTLQLDLRCVDQWPSSFGNLLRVAVKYDITILVDYLTEFMDGGTSNVEKLVRCLLLADQCGACILRRRLIDRLTESDETLGKAQDVFEFDQLSSEMAAEIHSRFFNRKKRARSSGDGHEFPDGSDWSRMSLAQLRRACTERGFCDDGNRAMLIASLTPEEVKG